MADSRVSPKSIWAQREEARSNLFSDAIPNLMTTLWSLTPQGFNARVGELRKARDANYADPMVDQLAQERAELGIPTTNGITRSNNSTSVDATPTPYQQITGTAPAPKPVASKPKAAPKKQTQQAPAATTPPPKSVGNPDWHDAGNSIPAQNYVNAMPVTRSAGMSPDTSYAEAAAISNAVQAEMDAANQAAFDNKYNQLLAMYGIAPGSGAPKVNQDAAMQYYGDQAVYDALARAYAGAPVFNAWG